MLGLENRAGFSMTHGRQIATLSSKMKRRFSSAKKRHTRRMQGRTHRLCASMIILSRGGRGEVLVLIVHKPRRRDAWQIPQGGVEPGETLLEAGKRELEEET